MLSILAPMLSFALVLPASRAPPMTHRAAAPVMATGNDAIRFPDLDGADVRVGIIRARWHDKICGDLVDGVKTSLKECGVSEDNIFESEVPGSFELPLATRYLALSNTVDVVVPIGVLIKGDTLHFEVIAESVTSSLMSVGLSTGLPVIFGVLTVNEESQATDRSTGSNNHGCARPLTAACQTRSPPTVVCPSPDSRRLQWGKAAVEMALLRQTALGTGKSRKSFLGFGGEPSEESKSDTSAPAKIGF